MRLEPNQTVTSPVSGVAYKIGRKLGEGGFGLAYQAWQLNRRKKPVEEVCLKTTPDQASWHRESYFGELLSRSKRVIQTLDSFPLVPARRGQRLLFALVLELADKGTVADYLESNGNKPWPEKRAVREIVALLKVLDQLHGGSATHRDLTPMNVFVCGNGTLKLGDFGIARHQLAGAPQTVDAFNPAFVTQGFLNDEHRYWNAVDDVYQMGQLLAMLLRGDPDTIVEPRMLRELACSDELRRVLQRALGPRKDRYADAFELSQALQGDEPAPSRLKNLSGKTVVFTGPLGLNRVDAQALVLQAGGQVAKSVTKQTDVLVQGGRSPNYKGGHKGAKLSAAQQLIKQGRKVHVIGEAEFRRLVRLDDARG